MNGTMKIARHEFITTAGNRTFAVMTVLGPFLILAMAVLPSILTRSAAEIGEDTRVGIICPEDGFLEELEQASAAAGISLVRFASKEQGAAAIREGTVQGFLEAPDDILGASSWSYFSKTGTDYMVVEAIGNLIGQATVSRRLTQAGLDPARVTSLTARPALSVQKIGKDGGEELQDFTGILLSVLGFVFVLYMTLIFYGQMIGHSIITEKASKTVEILLSSVRPLEIMFGKILGKGIAGLLQYTLWIGAALILTYLIGPRFNISIPDVLSAANLGWLLLFFVLAFFLYAGGYAAIGSAAENEQHMGQLSWPLLICLIIPLMMVTGIIMNPDSAVALVLSFIPFTAPVIMFARILVGTPPAWQIAVVIIELILSIVAMVYASAKIFRIGILMTGKRFNFPDIIRWIRT